MRPAAGPPDSAATITVTAPPGVRRMVLVVALALAALELALFLLLWRLGADLTPADDPRAATLFVALGSAATLQAMAVVGAAWVMVAVSRTTLHADAAGVSLDHPWRRWHGAWSDIDHAWLQNGWLVVEVHGLRRRWYVRTSAADSLDRVRAAIPSGAWLEGSARNLHLARTTLPILLAVTGVAGLLLVWALKLLEGLTQTPLAGG